MIKCIPIDQYPKGDGIRERILKDQNDFEWRIATMGGGFVVAYFGNPYFKQTSFEFQKGGEHVSIENTGCVFFDKKQKEIGPMACLIENSYTDDIWEKFEWYFIQKSKL